MGAPITPLSEGIEKNCPFSFSITKGLVLWSIDPSEVKVFHNTKKKTNVAINEIRDPIEDILFQAANASG